MSLPIDKCVQEKSQGSISAFVVCLTMSLLLLAGFVFDGGRVVARYAELSDIAENAARIGAQQVVGIRSGNPYLDERAASRRIESYLSDKKVVGRISVHDGGTVVEVRASVPMRMLSLIGIRERKILVSRTSFVVSG
jgi:hypothetical protein